MLSEKCFSQLIHSTEYQNRPILPPTPMRSEPKSSLKRLDAPSACGWTDSDLYYYLIQKRVITSILFFKNMGQDNGLSPSLLGPARREPSDKKFFA